MNEHDILIERLCRDAQPVKRPARPWLRTAGWMGAALPSGHAAALLLPHGHPDWTAPGAPWAALWIGLSFCLGMLAVRTALTVGIAGQPRPRWRLLAGLAAAWLAVAFVDVTPSAHPIGHLGDGMYCYTFMLVAGAPMAVLAVAALRRTRSLSPRASLAIAALGIGAATQVLLGFCHPVSGEVVDVLMHVAATLTLLVLTVLGGRRWVRV